MRRRGFAIFIFGFLITNIFAQSVDHWESLVNANNTWKYFPGTSEPPSSWINAAFDDTSWSEGPGGFGYGDNDDGTVISSTGSVYLRIKFTVDDPSIIEQAILLADFDDAFVAYLNGKEISRSGISGSRPSYNQYADALHEALVYQGLYPIEFFFNKTDIENNFEIGENVLAIQVHNFNATSSDLSSNFYLVAGINTSTRYFQSTPSWFREPVNFSASNLPIIKIDTKGRSIPDEPKISATMGIIDNGAGASNHVDDLFTDYYGPIGIEVRGSSSQGLFPKKQYAVELWTENGQDTSASVLDLPEEEDWVLYAPYSDKSLIRNFITYNLGEAMGWYAPRTRLVELYLNNQYQGVYVFTEKIKRDKNRVDINKLNPDENSGDDLTGGYIVKLDKYDGATQGLGWDSPFPPEGGTNNAVIQYQYHYPKEDEITPDQQNYIQNYITEFEASLIGPKYLDHQFGYRNYINVESFIDFSLINEVTKNVDGYRLSTFLYKDKDSNDGKIHLGPIWDFNLAFGNANYCEGGEYYGWAWDFNKICGGDHWMIPFWWRRLLRDPQYVVEYKNRWTELRQGILSDEKMMAFIDSTVNILDAPQQRNFSRWPILNEYIWPNNYVGGNYTNEINYLKTWINRRIQWLDTNIANLKIITDIKTDQLSQNAITIYPNPTPGPFTISINEANLGKITLSLHNNLGQKIGQKQIDSSPTETINFRFENLQSGIYFLKIVDQKNLIFARKIIVN